MNREASSSFAPLTSLAQLWRFLRAALSHATASLIAIAALLGSVRVLAILLSSWIGGAGGPPLRGLYRLVPAEIAAACMLIAVLIAEQCVRNGLRRLTAYVPAVLVAALVAGISSTPLILFTHDPSFTITSAHRYSEMAAIALFFSADALARGGLAAFIFANRERWLHSVRCLRDAELARACLERNIAKSRLIATETVMQPEALLSTLEALSSHYERDRSEADRRLAEFIDRLRSITASIPI